MRWRLYDSYSTIKAVPAVLAGHHPHWIQTRKGWEDRGRPALAGKLIDVSPQGLVMIEVEGRELRIWNHDSLRVAEAAALTSEKIRYQAR
jgi:hypothetical protein